MLPDLRRFHAIKRYLSKRNFSFRKKRSVKKGFGCQRKWMGKTWPHFDLCQAVRNWFESRRVSFESLWNRRNCIPDQDGLTQNHHSLQVNSGIPKLKRNNFSTEASFGGVVKTDCKHPWVIYCKSLKQYGWNATGAFDTRLYIALDESFRISWVGEACFAKETGPSLGSFSLRFTDGMSVAYNNFTKSAKRASEVAKSMVCETFVCQECILSQTRSEVRMDSCQGTLGPNTNIFA